MKKTFTKLAGGIMAASMILGTAGVAAPQVFAEGESGKVVTITQNAADTATHEYKAYQIFDGTYDSASKKLSDIVWGTGVKTTTAGKLDATADQITEIKKALGKENDADFDATDAMAVADALGANSTKDNANAQAFATAINALLTNAEKTVSGKGTVSFNKDGDTDNSLAGGYYLFKDTVTEGENEVGAMTRYILEMVQNTLNITAKSDVPTSEKKVDDKDDTTGAEDEVVWEDSADYDIGDVVPFQLKGTLPDNYAEYTKGYYYAFHDKESAGLTFNADSVEVYVKNGDTETKVGSGYTVKTDNTHADDCTFEVVFSNLKDIKDENDEAITTDKDSVIYVRYTSTLNENAVIGEAGNPNVSFLEFSNNPNSDGDGEKGTTPDDKVTVFTFKEIINKVDDQGALDKAGFTLYKVYNTNAAVKVPSRNADGTVVKDQEGKIVYTEVTPIKGSELTLPAGSSANATASFDKDKYYVLISTIGAAAGRTSFEFVGLDAGCYYLAETTVPDGYNAWAGAEFTITATHEADSADPQLLTLESSWDGTVVNKPAGSLTNTVINKSGTELPSTGGIGTTIFYIVGAAAAVTAIVLLTTRRRANKED